MRGDLGLEYGVDELIFWGNTENTGEKIHNEPQEAYRPVGKNGTIHAFYAL